MTTKHVPALMLALTALFLAGCGSTAVHAPAAEPTPNPSSAFAQAYQAALSNALQGMPPYPAAASVLRRHPKELASAIKASLAADPLVTALQGTSGWSLLSELPSSLAVPIVEQAIARYGVAAPNGFDVPTAFLLSEVRHGPPWAVRAALQSLFLNRAASSALWLTALAAIPAADAESAQVGYYLPSSPMWLQEVLSSARISSTVKRAILSETYLITPDEFALLNRYANEVPDPALEEQILVDLAENGAPGSVQELADFTDRRHAFPGVVWPASLMLAVKQADPHGYIAQGMADVSALTGTAYTDIHRCIPHTNQCGFYLEGPAQYDPTQLPEWQALLTRLQGHPGSDDIAYIIGREEEIGHHYGKAVLAFDQALTLPDGGMQYDAASRLVWVLDVEMTSSAIDRLIPSAPAELRPLLRYAAAVHLLREGRLSQAVAGLKAAAARSGQIVAALPGISYIQTPFLQFFIARQLRAAEKLQSLAQASRTPEGAFRLAQYNFQNPLLYYMGLWQGSRAIYIAFSSGGTYPTPAWMRYQAEFNNYAVAARLYARAARLAGQNAALRARDLYGEGESLVELSNYGSGTDLYPPYELYGHTESLLRTAAAADPHAAIGGKALMSLYYLTGDTKLLARVVRDYPGTSSAYDAALRLQPAHRYTAHPPTGPQFLDFQPLFTTNRLSAREKAAMSSSSGTRSQVIAGETLLSIAPRLQPGVQPVITGVEETSRGSLLMQWGTYVPVDVPGLQPVYFPGRAYARVFGVFREVRFTRVSYSFFPGLG